MHDPILKFSEWLNDAQKHPKIAEPTAMTLATATTDGVPSARIVLLKAHGPEGFHFFTNYESRKSGELKTNPHAALCFYWMPLERQVRIEGTISMLSAEASDAYFNSRPRDRQIGAWASLQSQPLTDRDALEARVAALEAQYPSAVPRPPHWGGWKLTPHRIEFWHQNWARLHAREEYVLTESSWKHQLLYP